MSPQLITKKASLNSNGESPRKETSASASDVSHQDGELERGRKPEADDGDAVQPDENTGADGDGALQSGNGQPPRKRKRSRKDDKKYHCPQGGCGKSYSRAEHLYRHQLNHTPKQIYRCDFPGCFREFVRGDLCTRHRERHTARGTNLPSGMVEGGGAYRDRSPQQGQSMDDSSGRPYHDLHVNTTPYPPKPQEPHTGRVQSPLSGVSNHGRSTNSTPLDDQYKSPQSYHSSMNAATFPSTADVRGITNDGQYYPESSSAGNDRAQSHASTEPTRRQSSFGATNSVRFSKPAIGSPHIPPSFHTNGKQGQYGPESPGVQYAPTRQMSRQSNASATYIPHQQFPPLATLPPPSYPNISYAAPTTSSLQYEPGISSYDSRTASSSEMVGSNGSSSSNTAVADGFVPVFGGDGYSSSPFAIADDFTSWLFSGENAPLDAQRRGSMSLGGGFMMESSAVVAPPMPLQRPMAVANIIDPALSETILSEARRQTLLELIRERFNETVDAPVRKQKEDLLDGDIDREGHVLSLRMMQTYIGSYWYHFHNQLPILHQPTFTADDAEDLLLLAVMAIGAANLDKMHGHDVTQAGAELANFLVWHLRGELFTHADFRPPAKLWVFQALLLSEVYEKMYANRILHERANIFHAVTLTLMRRGSSLMGRSPLDSPPGMRGETYSIANTSDQWWNHWITNEATRRIALAAFIIDSTHSALFGHSAIMVAHEMRLPLPCDASLWSSMSGVEVGKIESELQASGVKPVSFLEGLKRTLNGQPVRTNSFGRIAIMAGLLNVSFHLGQRDLQVRSLGVIGGKDLWRGSLLRAFDVWEKGWEISMKESSGRPFQSSKAIISMDEDNVFESRVVLFHLSHIAMHVDVVQCQIFAKAKRLLGRTITEQDYKISQRRIKEFWAPKASARDASFFALRFLCQVLAPDLLNSSNTTGHSINRAGIGAEAYSARNDYLLNRPWVLYFAALVVFSYGYALDGPLINPPVLETREEQIADLRTFLGRVGRVPAPDDLATMNDRNACMGLLMILSEAFSKCRWELMHEASGLLNNCIAMLRGMG